MDAVTITQAPEETLSKVAVQYPHVQGEMGVVHQPKSAENEKQNKVKTEDSNKVAHEIADQMNQVSSLLKTSLAFSVDEGTGRNVIKVINSDTEEVIRQIPPENMLKLIGNMKNVMGMLLDVEI